MHFYPKNLLSYEEFQPRNILLTLPNRFNITKEKDPQNATLLTTWVRTCGTTVVDYESFLLASSRMVHT